MKKTIKRHRGLLRPLGTGAALLAMMISVAACTPAQTNTTSTTTAAEKTVIKVGTKDFTENLIVGELYALALEDAGFQVKRVPNIAGSIINTALLNSEIDLYPEYTGTGLLAILKLAPLTDPDAVYQAVKEGYKKFNLTWLDYSQANDGQGLVIRTETAKRLGIKTISDLQKNATQIRFATQGEFDLRDDALPALDKVYGKFNWKSSKLYDNSLKYQVLANNEADVAPAYTTEGQLVNTDQFLLLEDDKHVWPPYNLAPVVRDSILKADPGIAPALNRISAALNTKNITELNAKVDVEKQEVEKVALDFFKSLK